MTSKTMVRKQSQVGHAIVEFSLMAPWLFFLFVGALDGGFYANQFISVQNAARIAALNAGFTATGAASQSDACYHVRRELAAMPNAASFPLNCDSSPLVVTVAAITDAESMPASRVRVSYQGPQMIPIPGLFPGRLTINRTVDVRVYGE